MHMQINGQHMQINGQYLFPQKDADQKSTHFWKVVAFDLPHVQMSAEPSIKKIRRSMVNKADQRSPLLVQTARFCLIL